MVVELGAHRLTVRKGAAMILQTNIGVGKTKTPTPGGLYYIKELLKPTDPNTVYGPYAYGLSGFSNVLQTFAGGPGVVGVHGTNDPGGLGQDVSAGCIRMPNADIVRLVDEIGLPLGVPVEIRA
jgi:lipoprotein-anchoring transpeptidase ErfK/SrfK